MGENEYDTAARPLSVGHATPLRGTARPLENNDLPGRPANAGLVAPLVVDGAINGELFRGYVQQHLAPTLTSGDIVILDNLNSHKVAGVRAAIEAVGAELWYLPPYSPDFNPIEQVFAKFKWMIRGAQERTVAGLWKRCGQLIERFSETECRNYFKHCGYRYV